LGTFGISGIWWTCLRLVDRTHNYPGLITGHASGQQCTSNLGAGYPSLFHQFGGLGSRKKGVPDAGRNDIAYRSIFGRWSFHDTRYNRIISRELQGLHARCYNKSVLGVLANKLKECLRSPAAFSGRLPWAHAEELPLYPERIRHWPRLCSRERWEQFKQIAKICGVCRYWRISPGYICGGMSWRRSSSLKLL